MKNFEDEYKCSPDNSKEDEQLAIEAKRGSREARNLLYMRHYELAKQLARPANRFLRIAAMLRGGSLPIEPDDIRQQAFICFCDLLTIWQPEEEPFMDCLQRKMPRLLLRYVHRMLDYRRHKPLNVPLDMEKSGNEMESLLPQPSVHADAVTIWEQQTKILPGTLRRTVKLRYYDDLSSTQIAVIRGLTKRTINRNLHTAVSMIRTNLQDDWESCG